jgi:addiction module RelB/DinJ family antitoxin
MKRSAILQARVRPEIKFAAERVLESLGITMTEVMELFMRRLIVDRKIPFEVIALDEKALARIERDWSERNKSVSV